MQGIRSRLQVPWKMGIYKYLPLQQQVPCSGRCFSLESLVCFARRRVCWCRAAASPHIVPGIGIGLVDWSVHTGPCPVQSSNESPPKIRKNSHLGCSVDGSGHQPLDTTWALHYCICFTLGPFYASKSHYNVRRPMIERKWLYKGASIISTGSSCK